MREKYMSNFMSKGISSTNPQLLFLPVIGPVFATHYRWPLVVDKHKPASLNLDIWSLSHGFCLFCDIFAGFFEVILLFSRTRAIGYESVDFVDETENDLSDIAVSTILNEKFAKENVEGRNKPKKGNPQPAVDDEGRIYKDDVQDGLKTVIQHTLELDGPPPKIGQYPFHHRQYIAKSFIYRRVSKQWWFQYYPGFWAGISGLNGWYLFREPLKNAVKTILDSVLGIWPTGYDLCAPGPLGEFGFAENGFDERAEKCPESAGGNCSVKDQADYIPGEARYGEDSNGNSMEAGDIFERQNKWKPGGGEYSKSFNKRHGFDIPV
jgi:hypothetical protein